MYYIYKFLDENQKEIYIGITNNIKRRVSQQHFTSNGHLNKLCYEETRYIVYSKCLNKDDAKIKERYLINELEPKYDKIHNNKQKFNFIIDDFNWRYIPFNKEKYLKSIKNSTINKENSYSLNKFDKIDLPLNSVEIENEVDYAKQKIKLIKNKGLKVACVFSIDPKEKVYAVNINGIKYIPFYNIERALGIYGPMASNKLSHLIRNKIIDANDIIAVSDIEFIKRVIISNVSTVYGREIYPGKIYLINEKIVPLVVENLIGKNINKYIRPENSNAYKFKKYLFVLWVEVSFNVKILPTENRF